MSPDAIAALISGAGVLISLVGAAYIAGVKEGSLNARLSGIERDVAEIKGMFRYRLRKDDE